MAESDGNGAGALCEAALRLLDMATQTAPIRGAAGSDSIGQLALIAAILDLTDAVRDMQEPVQTYISMDGPDHAPRDC